MSTNSKTIRYNCDFKTNYHITITQYSTFTIVDIADSSTSVKKIKSPRTPRTPRKTNTESIQKTTPIKQSPKTIKHINRYLNTIAVDPSMIWYETYVQIEPIPEGMEVDRNEEKVKHEFEHILSNIYLTKRKLKRMVII